MHVATGQCRGPLSRAGWVVLTAGSYAQGLNGSPRAASGHWAPLMRGNVPSNHMFQKACINPSPHGQPQRVN